MTLYWAGPQNTMVASGRSACALDCLGGWKPGHVSLGCGFPLKLRRPSWDTPGASLKAGATCTGKSGGWSALPALQICLRSSGATATAWSEATAAGNCREVMHQLQKLKGCGGQHSRN